MSHAERVRDLTDMKLHNRALIWELILKSRPVSRARLAKMTDMSPTSITRIVGELDAFGLLVEAPSTRGGVGRKATMIGVDRDAVICVGADIDVDMVRTCLVDLEGVTRCCLERKVADNLAAPREIAVAAHAMYEEMLAICGIDESRVRALGVGVGGTVDRETGNVVASPQLHWRNAGVKDLFEERFRLPARIENDVKAAVYEEYARYPECRADSVAYLTIGHGIGSAVMYGGKLLRGGRNAAGEIGHITVRPDGDMCDCGRRGCLYSCLSEKAILKRIRRHGRSRAGMERWSLARVEGEPWALDLAGEVAGYIAMALNHILCSYDPEIVIVGGRLLYAQPDLLDLALGTRGFIYDALRSDARIMHSISRQRDTVAGVALMAQAAFLQNLLNETPRTSLQSY
jgi:predicted NBD/HSP70 family sugar kinase